MKRIVIVLIFYSLFIVCLKAESETKIFHLGERVYKSMDNKWYNFSNGEKGDQILPDRLIVRKKDHGKLTRNDLIKLELRNSEIVFAKLFGGYYVVKILSSQEGVCIILCKRSFNQRALL